MNSKVDEYISHAKKWQEEMKELRRVLLDCGLTEEFKWRQPCYTYENGNIAIIQAFKEYLALLFFKGVLLKDPKGILQKTGENTRVGRQVRFANASDIVEMEPIVKNLIQEAVEVEKAGLKVDSIEKPKLEYPDEFQKKLDEMPPLKTAFDALTPGRQRAYVYYFSQAKQSKTRESRVEKYMQKILDGKGLND